MLYLFTYVTVRVGLICETIDRGVNTMLLRNINNRYCTFARRQSTINSNCFRRAVDFRLGARVGLLSNGGTRRVSEQFYLCTQNAEVKINFTSKPFIRHSIIDYVVSLCARIAHLALTSRMCSITEHISSISRRFKRRIKISDLQSGIPRF